MNKMIYEGIDRWSTTLSHAWGSRYTAHKYYKKVGKGENARYFYSPEEYAHFLKKTSSVGERNAAIKNQKDYLDRKLTSLRGFAKKHLNDRTRSNNYYSTMHKNNLARTNKDWNRADWKGTHTVGTKSRSIAGLRNSASKRNLARDAFAAINEARDAAGRKVKTARRGLGTLGKSARKNVFGKKKNRVNYEIGPHNRKAKGLSMERNGHQEARGIRNIGTLQASGKRHVNSLFGKKRKKKTRSLKTGK